jgi:hypothetical protein
MFLSEEKNQKTFTSCASSTLPATTRIYQLSKEAKVFWFFSSEKNVLAVLPYLRKWQSGFTVPLKGCQLCVDPSSGTPI